MEYVELLTGDLPLLLNDVIRERDELITEVQRVKEELGNANEYGDCEHNYADCLKREIKQAREERDDAREYADRERQLAYELKAERDEAREAARLFRDLYVSQVGRTYPEEYTLPWEREE